MYNQHMTREEILSASDQELLAEIDKIKYLYRMKHVYRYDFTHNEPGIIESNADHVYSLLVLMDYFLPLEDPEGLLDQTRVRQSR